MKMAGPSRSRPCRTSCSARSVVPATLVAVIPAVTRAFGAPDPVGARRTMRTAFDAHAMARRTMPAEPTAFAFVMAAVDLDDARLNSWRLAEAGARSGLGRSRSKKCEGRKCDDLSEFHTGLHLSTPLITALTREPIDIRRESSAVICSRSSKPRNAAGRGYRLPDHGIFWTINFRSNDVRF